LLKKIRQGLFSQPLRSNKGNLVTT